MEFNILKQVVGNIQQTIENAAVASVNAIKANVFGVTVKNFPKNQKINGIVSVSNQKRVETELKKATVTQKTILKWLKSLKFPTSIKVDNFPDYPKFPEFPTEIKVKNFPKQKEYPKNIRVLNQPTKEIKEVRDAIKALEKATKALKLNPTINVEAPKPEKVVVPPASVSVTQQEIDYEKLASLIPVPESFDYKKLAESIAEELAASIVTIGGGGGGRRNEGQDDLTREYNVADKDTDGAIKYYGFTGRSGQWYILREDTGSNEFRYVKGSNSYPTNWASRASQEYDYYHEVF